ncbi:hypothetical protein AQS70_18865 [Pseudomonas endophytica]|uniref:Virulence factor Evf domain-containing protein n=1 Tax=Pseudomonas endophytica TaxID=1563157 RepID=A0A0Q1CKA4_9PSED|nr:hypothetical protein [Pseudomonas endophytica]KQB55354.1 hypothetical protein AQS70_18865 [Pseudomonas endophytica]
MNFVKEVLPTPEETDLFFNALPAVIQPKFAKLKVESQVSNVSTEEEAFIGATSPIVIAFADGVSPENRSAVMNSTQFAEKVADSVASRKTEALEWYEAYGKAISNCGWFSTSFVFVGHDTSKVNVTMDSLVLDIIAQVAGFNAAAILPLLKNVFDTIKSSNELITLFDNNSKGDRVGSFQIVPCLESAKGIPVTVFAGLECEFNSIEGGAWFWKWKCSNLKVKKAATMINLNMDSYKRAESRILDYLGQGQDDFFLSLKKTPKK